MIFKGVGRLKERMLAIVLNKLDTNVSLKKSNKSTFLKTYSTVNFEMDHNQLVADITIMEWCVCACMIVSCCFDFGRYGPAMLCQMQSGFFFSDEWTIWRIWGGKKEIAKKKFSLLVPLFKYHKIVNRIGIFHVNLPFVGLTLVPWGQASENDHGWSLGIPECHKYRNCAAVSPLYQVNSDYKSW